jgi:glycosyltransferase involved in cell wall biosynthesis
MRILYIDGVGPFGGASRSLFEMLRAGRRDKFDRLFLVQRGTASDYYRQVADDVVAVAGITRFDNTQYSHYRGVRWLILLRELAYVPFTVVALARAWLKWRRVDVVHANEVLEIAPAIAASLLFRAPLVVHVRSPQRRDWRSLRTRLLHAALRRFAARIVAIDEGVRATLPPDLDVVVIHNSFAPQPSEHPDKVLRSALERFSRTSALKVGFVGNLHASKGVDCLVDAAEILARSGRSCEFLLVGGQTARASGLAWRLLDMVGLAQNRGDVIAQRIARSPARDRIHLLGATADIDALYKVVDVILFPSHFDAPGRPVFEAALYGVPSVVAVREPYPDTLVDGVTGVAISAPQGALLAAALEQLDGDRSLVKRMGSAARSLGQSNFMPATNAAKMEAVYEDIVQKRRAPSR